jgi:hypothetical protein
MQFAWSKFCLLASGLLVVGGCGGPPPDPIVVTGVAYFAAGTETEDPTSGSDTSAEVVGKPIVGAKVTFHDHDIAVGYGITDKLGRFRIRSHPTRAETIDGLPEGLYAVTITKLSLVEVSSTEGASGSEKFDELHLPVRYAHPDTTEWQLMKVKLETSTNHFHLAVKE